MDLKEEKLSLPHIHNSIESVINSIRKQHDDLEAKIGDHAKIKRIVEEVLKPICQDANRHKIESSEVLRLLMSFHKPVSCAITACQVGRMDISTSPNNDEEVKDTTKVNSERSFLPPVVPAHDSCVSARRPHPPFQSCKRYPALTNAFIKCPRGFGESTGLTIPFRRIPSLPVNIAPITYDKSEALTSECYEELRCYVDDVEGYTNTLQAMYSTISQRVLVPLRTFCKQKQSRTQTRLIDKINTEEKVFQDKSALNEAQSSEFMMIQTMNKLKQLLWPSADGVPAHLYSQHGASYELSNIVDCKRFPVVRLLTDILQKFAEVLYYAIVWLKDDKLYAEKAKRGFDRAHRRYVKSRRKWHEAQQIYRQLLSEWRHSHAEVCANEERMNKLMQDVAMERAEMKKTHDQRRTLDMEISEGTDNFDHLKARKRAIEKRIGVIHLKIKTRERNHRFLETHVKSLKADHEVMGEKLQNAKESTDFLQTKMQQLYNSRAAWLARYQEKTNLEVLKSRLNEAMLRIPLPALREKTFVLKSRSENLQEALFIVSDRLNNNGIHWSTFCYHLSWPDCFLTSLPDADVNHKPSSDDSEDSSSTSSAASTSAGKPQPRDWYGKQNLSTNKVVKYVKEQCAGGESQQRMFMLNLWLHHNGEQASIDKLLSALRLSRIPKLLARVELN